MADTEQNLIIDYLTKIHQQLDMLERISTEIEQSNNKHRLIAGNIRRGKMEVASELNTDVVDVSSSRYIRDENRIIISAPEIIIGDVDKNGNLLSSAGSSRVVLRSNQVNLEGVSKDDGAVGIVSTRAPKIHQIAVDPGIDGKENYRTSTSEVLSVAKGIELRSEANRFCVIRDVNEPVSKGLHLLSTTDINLSSIAEYKAENAKLNERLDNLENEIKEIEEQIREVKVPIDKLMQKITDHANSEIYQLTAPERFSMPFSYARVDDANRKLESYLIALLKYFNRYSKLYSQLFELKRISCYFVEKVLRFSINEQQGDYHFENIPTHSHINIKAPSIALRTEDGDGNFRQDGHIRLRTKKLEAFGRAHARASETSENNSEISIRFDKLLVDTSSKTTAEDGTKYSYKANGSIKLRSQKILMESVDYDRKRGERKRENEVLNASGSIEMNAHKVKMGSRLNEKNEGSVSIDAKKVNITSFVDVDGKRSVVPGSHLKLLSEQIKMGRETYKTESNEEIKLFPEEITIAAKKGVYVQTGLFQTQILKDLTDTQNGENLLLFKPEAGFNIVSKDPAKIYVDSQLKAEFTKDNVTVTPALEAKTSIKTPSITTDNMEVGKHFKSPSTEEGVAIKSAPPSSTKVAFSPEEDQLTEEIIELKLSDARIKANELWEKYWEQVKVVMSAEKEVEQKLMKAERKRTSKLEIEIELDRVKNRVIKGEQREQELLLGAKKAEEEMVKYAKKRDKDFKKHKDTQTEEYKRYDTQFGIYKNLNSNKKGEADSKHIELENLKKEEALLKEMLKTAEEAYDEANKEVENATKALKKERKEEEKRSKEADEAEKKAKEEEGKY
ncbi:hypothetical protein [Parabacteroides sp.]